MHNSPNIPNMHNIPNISNMHNMPMPMPMPNTITITINHHRASSATEMCTVNESLLFNIRCLRRLTVTVETARSKKHSTR